MTDPTGPVMPDQPLVFYTLDFWISQRTTPTNATNLDDLNTAITWSGATGIPIYLVKNYTFQATNTTKSIVLAPNAQVICAPTSLNTGTLTWSPYNGDPTPPAGIVTNPVGGTSTGARWSGGTFVGLDFSGYPNLDFFNLIGDNILLENIAVKNCVGSAFSLNGDGIYLINPTVMNTVATTSKGVRFTGGKGFRLLDGNITAKDDALVVSPGSGTVPSSKVEVNDCAIQGVTLTNSPGSGTSTSRLILITTTTAGAVANVRVEGVTCHGAEGTGAAIQLLNPNRANGARISNVSFRDIVIDWQGRTTTAAAIVVNNALALSRAIATVTFDTVRVVKPKGPTLSVVSTQDAIEDLRWNGGTVPFDSVPTYSTSCISLDGLASGTFSSLTIAAGSDGPVVSVGGTSICKNITFSE